MDFIRVFVHGRRVHICWVSDSCANLSGLEPSHSSMEASRPLFVVECAAAGCLFMCTHAVLRRSISFRKKLNIGDSDHHLKMMQSTIRGKLTRLLRANSSVDSFEQELKFFRLKWTRRGHDGKEFDRNPWLAKKTLVGHPKTVKPKQNTTSPGVCVIDKHVKVAQRFFGRECKPIVARTVAPNLFRRMYSESGLTVCFSFFFGVVPKVRSRFAAPPYQQLSPACVRRFFALAELSFNETRREKTPIVIGCVSLAWFIVVFVLLFG